MLGKCANPVCRAVFRKLGSGKLFTFELIVTAKSVADESNAQKIRGPVFFWLCKSCSLIFTLALDNSGQLMLSRISDGAGAADCSHQGIIETFV